MPTTWLTADVLSFGNWNRTQTGGFADVSSLLLDGATKYLDISTGAQFSVSQAFSISLWVNFTSLSGDQVFLSNRALGGDSSGWGFEYQAGTLYWQIVKDLSNFVTARFDGSGIATNGWYFLCAAYDGTGASTGASAFTLSINGSSLAQSGNTVTGTLATPTYSVATKIGASDNSGPANFLNAYIDELAIWTTALSGTDMNRLYNNGLPTDLSGDSKAGNLYGWWRFENSGVSPIDTFSTVKDRIGTHDANGHSLVAGDFKTNVPSTAVAAGPGGVGYLLKMWMKASDTAAFNSGSISDNGAVSNWKGSNSGSLANFQPVIAANKPTWKQSSISGQPGVEFTNAYGLVDTAETICSDNTVPLTIIIVCRLDGYGFGASSSDGSQVEGAGYSGVFEYFPPSAGHSQGALYTCSPNMFFTDTSLGAGYDNFKKLYWGTEGNTGTGFPSIRVSSTYGTAGGTNYVIVLTYDGSGIQAGVKSYSGTSATSETVALGDLTNAQCAMTAANYLGCVRGGLLNDFFCLVGAIGDLIVYKRVLSSTEITTIMTNYITPKYGTISA